ncbi:hypothetical protein [Methylovulum psychrotolerans]|nr:hypothetical protein [Methylovulum psychrotolerans]
MATFIKKGFLLLLLCTLSACAVYPAGGYGGGYGYWDTALR